jgi:ATP-dependent helicase Lhr and Lhr-like helicase
MIDPFDRLCTALQIQIVNGLGWTGLRPVQEQTTDAVLDGHNCVVLAPTAGGKTEAAFFPLLSQMHDEDWRPTSVLYVAPIRALLNNQAARLDKLTGLLGRRAFKWHGDVGASRRSRFLAEPADVLSITPESLEAMLLSTRVPARYVLGNVRAIVIDEVHSFAANDRGAHLVALIERIQRICGHDIQRIGLSATVGDPDAIAAWQGGSSLRPARVVDPGGQKAKPEIALDFVGNLENAATLVDRLYPGTRRLVFVDSRRRVEQLGDLLRRREVITYLSHSSLSVAERSAAERAFEEEDNCVIVATSALELGIDVGDLDHVLQIDAPGTVSSFLQRMGRTGRRPGTEPNCTFLATSDAYLLQSAALLRLHGDGYVEPTAPGRRASHVLAHQLMALALQESGVGTADWWRQLVGASSFADITEAERAELVAHMLANDILVEVDGRYLLGAAGERRYGGRNFLDLYAVFSTAPVLLVLHGDHEIGTVDATFLMDEAAGPAAFVLGGRAWAVVDIAWKKGRCRVVPADRGAYPRWFGRPQHLSRALCEAMRDVLLDEESGAAWSKRARARMKEIRTEYTFLQDDVRPLVDDGDRVRWWTFAGGKLNQLYAGLLRRDLGGGVSSNNLCVTFSERAALSVAGIREALNGIDGRATWEAALELAPDAARLRVSKFQVCLPERLERDLVAGAAMEAAGEAS